MHRPICNLFHHRNTGIDRFQYLGIHRIFGGGVGTSHFSLLFRPLLGGCYYAYAWERERERERERESVCVCVFLISSNLPATPTHTPLLCAPWHTVVQARKNVIDNVHMQYYIAADTKTETQRFLELATAIIKINKTVKINLPATGNTHPPCLEPHKIWAKYSFHLFSGMCNRDGFQPKRKVCPVSCCGRTEDVSLMNSELLNCRKLLKIDVGKYIIPELGQLCKQISVFHEIDIESQKENGCG